MSLSNEAIQRFRQLVREEGLRNAVGEACKYIDDVISDDVMLKRKYKSQYQDSPKYLNVGGGRFVREHWRVLDSPFGSYDERSPLIDYEADLESQEQWDIESNSFDLVYSSATLEHLSQSAVEHTLSECHRVLKPGGGIHITVPDAELAMRKYEQGDEQWMREIKRIPRKIQTRSDYQPCTPGNLQEYFLMHFVSTPLIMHDYPDVNLSTVREDFDKLGYSEFLDKYTSKIDESWNDHPRYPRGHRNWFDEDKLRSLLTEQGFRDCNRVLTNRSQFTELCNDVFDPRPAWSVHVEAVK